MPMSKVPTQVMFTCETCGRASTADARMAAHLLPFKRKLPIQPNGLCRDCSGDRWTITAVFSETEMDLAESALGLGLAAATGIGFVQHSTAAHSFVYPGIPASLVAQLDEIPAERLARVAVFVREMERSKREEQGAQRCLTCDAVFMGTAGQSWHAAGYCSKLCLAQSQKNSAAAPASSASSPAPQKANTVRVQCASGHFFEVPVSFMGMMRPCPQCGTKTPVTAMPEARSDPIRATHSEQQARGEDGEKLARNLVAAILADRFRERVFQFHADADLTPNERVAAFRRLEQLVKSQKWRLKFTSIEIAGGIEDCVSVYFLGSSRAWIILSAGFHYDTRQWKIDAYETADRSFARPEGETFEEYVLQSIHEAKAQGRPYVRQTAMKNGTYYIEY